MNIFYLSNDVEECARMHVDKHCVKMILEYAQLLSTAHRVLDGIQDITLSKSGRRKKVWTLNDTMYDEALYQATHINHPSSVWVRKSAYNYNWLSDLLYALCKEYTYRYSKVHKVEASGLENILAFAPPYNIGSDPWSEPTPAMPDEYIVEGNSIQSYRNYYNGTKTRMYKWKKRDVPDWVINSVN